MDVTFHYQARSKFCDGILTIASAQIHISLILASMLNTFSDTYITIAAMFLNYSVDSVVRTASDEILSVLSRN